MSLLDQATSWARTHKGQAAGGAAVTGVIVLALYERRKKNTAANTAGAGAFPTATTSAAGQPSWSYPATAGIVPPNTSGTDIQNAVQDQLNQALSAVQQMVGNNTSTAGNPNTPPGPSTPQFYVGQAAQGLTYVRDNATGEIDQIGPTGVPYHLAPWQFAALGYPKWNGYGGPPPAPRPAAPAPPARAAITR